MSTTTSIAHAGLEGIPVAETALSDVDGKAGRLILCGCDLEDFAARHTFESAAATFWASAQQNEAAAPPAVEAALGTAREATFEWMTELAPAFKRLTLSEGLRLGLAAVPGGQSSPHIAVTGAIPVLIANIARLKAGKSFSPPQAAAPHVEDFLRMLTDATPSKKHVAALSTYLVTVMDHGMNASTFAARVIASTHADLISVVVGAYAALTGPLHGGAPEPVLQMLDAIATPERAASWIEERLADGERIMGFGHRVYRVRDPRADVLKSALDALNPSGDRLALARAVEAAALDALARHKPERTLETNVELYTAMLLEAIGMPSSAFTPLFAMGRVVGWTAHAIEQRRSGRLIRPASLYVGETPSH